MRPIWTRRELIARGAEIGIGSSLLRAAAKDTETGNHRIQVVSWHPYYRWLSREVKSFNAIHSVLLPWKDPVRGGTDPFIAVSQRRHVYVTTASAPKLFTSRDNGKSWNSRELALSPPHQNEGIQSFGILEDDTLLVAYQIDRSVLVSCSHDLSKTWQSSVRLDTSPYEYAGGGTHGFLLQLPDGTILLPLGHYWENQEEVAGALFLYRSRDGGCTWGNRSQPGLLLGLGG